MSELHRRRAQVETISVYVLMFAVNAALLPLLMEVARWPSLAAQALSVAITTIVSYLGHRYFSFRRGAH